VAGEGVELRFGLLGATAAVESWGGGGLVVGIGGAASAVGDRQAADEAGGDGLSEPDMEEAGGNDVSELETGNGGPRGGRMVGSCALAMARRTRLRATLIKSVGSATHTALNSITISFSISGCRLLLNPSHLESKVRTNLKLV
jgi:hypothetical protein